MSSRGLRRHTLRCALILSIGLMGCVAMAPCRATDPTLHLEPAEANIALTGRPGSDLSLTQRLSVVSDQAVPDLLFRPSDLRTTDGQVIARSQLQLVSADSVKNLVENTPRDIDIKVTGLKVPGSYTGVIDFVLPKHGVTPALHIPFTLQVQETPKLSIRKGSESIKIQLVNCVWISCYFHTTEDLQEQFNFPLDNGSLLPASLPDAAVSATGDLHRHNTADAITLTTPLEISQKPIVSIPFQITTAKLPPDHYLGDFQLRIPGKDEPLKIPFELNVRDSCILPIVALVVGILFGRLIKYMKEKGTPQAELLHQYFQVQAHAEQNPADAGLLKDLLQRARMHISALQLDAGKSDLAMLENRLTLLARLRSLDAVLTPRAADPGVGDILKNINLVRNQISLGVDPTDTGKAIEEQVQKLAPPPGAANPPARALELAAAASVKSAAPMAMKGVKYGENMGLWRKSVAFVTGHSEVLRADVTYWLLRPLIWLVLIVLLVLTGFIQLYWKNPTFGADFLSDYFGLIAWAASADVAGRTLSNFKG